MSGIKIAGIVFLAVIALFISAVFFVSHRDAHPLKKEFARVEVGGGVVHAEVVRDDRSRAAGLSGRASLPEGEGMLFVFDAVGPHAIWMRGMQFPIDILWIRGDTVVDIAENVSPSEAGTADFALPVYRPDRDAEFVLEIGAGFSETHNVRIGNRITFAFESTDTRQTLLENSTAANALEAGFVDVGFPGVSYTIEALRKSPIRGTSFRSVRLVRKTVQYRKYEIQYQLDTLKLSGIMNVPSGVPPAHGFPVLILNHGLIRPSIYFSGRGSRREQDFFARHGYVTIHPDYRGHASSSPNPDTHHDFYVGYTEDVIGLIDALKESALPFIDTVRMGMWGHSMGGGIAARVMVLRPDIRAYVLFAPISADAEDNFYELSQPEVAWLRRTFGAAGAEIYKKISPLSYFNDAAAPVQIHHGTTDVDVPMYFSEKIFQTLRQYGKKAEFFIYPGQRHEFIEDWQLAAERALQFFDKYVKGAR